ncbi:MAG: ATPase, T2SS/T4P/T4SS family, partial [Patescibacteria group bacterium]
MPLSSDQFRNLLVEPGYVAAADFDAALKESEKKNQTLEETLVDKGFIPDEYLGQLVADAIGYPFARISVEKIPDHILRVIPERVAKKKLVVVLGVDNRGRIRIAMHDPDDLDMIRLVEKKIGKRAVPYFATLKGLHSGFERYTKDLESAIKSLFEEYGLLSAAGTADAERDGKVVRIVGMIMNYAYQSNASDVHIEPRENEVLVRYRIDGILHDVVSLPKNVVDPLLARIKILSNLRTDEHMAAQDGKFQELIEGERIDVRVSILPVVEGEKIVMRLLAEKGKRFSLEDLGLLDRDLKTVNRHAQKSFGMILATGPTGSGKTTTMYAILKILNTRDVNIATIEDPIEYQIEGVNQIQVNQRTGLNFASGLRSIVRQDPDIIMVGEIRDEETAGIAVNAAMTGHLVLSTLHTNDAATTLPRLLDMKIEPFLIASSVNMIIAQRLVRHICQRCVVSHALDVDSFKDRLPPALVKKYLQPRKKGVPLSAYKGKGCEACALTGYRGRVGVFEVLE